MAASFHDQQDQQCGDLGAAPVLVVPSHRLQYGTGHVRYASDGQPGDERCPVSAGHTGRLRGARVSVGEMGTSVRLLRGKSCPLEIEHITPRSKSRDDRVCNLTLACEPCNTKKGTQDIRDFLKHKPDLLSKILAQAKAPLKDAAAVNVTRWALYRRLQAVGLPVECGSGGLTKYNRTMRDLPKAHWIDAACVGESTPEVLKGQGVVPLLVTAQGHGSRQVTNVDRYGFPKGKPKQGGRVKGFRTGDMVKAIVPTGTKQGTYMGRVLVRGSGSFDIVTKTARVAGISWKYCRVVQRTEGYRYAS